MFQFIFWFISALWSGRLWELGKIKVRLWTIQAYHGLEGLRSGPLVWIQTQYAIWNLLKLEESHLKSDLDKRAEKILPHVETGVRKSSAGGGGMSGGMGGMSGGAMAMPPVATITTDIVLIGGGHAHVWVLKNFGMNPVPGVQLTLITKDVLTPYSGMLPGFVAGKYTSEELHIDLTVLARFARARLVHAEAVHIDRDRRLVHVKGRRPPVPYDYLSVDIGSCPTPPALSHSTIVPVTPVKPISSFSLLWDEFLSAVRKTTKPVTIVTVGGGAGGVELTLSMQARVNKEVDDPSLVRFILVSKSNRILPLHAPRAAELMMKVLKQRGISVLLKTEVLGAEGSELICQDGNRLPCDHCFWCTNAGAAPWLRGTGLELDELGFIKVKATLQSINDDRIFAAGDIACLEDPRPKAGVFAVRAGMPLAANLRTLATLGEKGVLQNYQPQTSFLGIIGTGDPATCVASKSTMAVQGAWLWHMKDWIDRGWMYGYQQALKGPEPVEGEEELAPLMRCGGCGSKVASTVLSRVLQQLDIVTRPEVVMGVGQDCAVLAPSKKHSLHTVDFFKSFISDPFLFGKIAATHALSDVYAMGGSPVSAMAMLVLPYASERKMEELAVQVMAGACEVLREANCALVGGHSAEGVDLSLGFAVNGEVDPPEDKGPLSKGGFKQGDVIILTKPIGTGTIFAAEMRRHCKAEWVDSALQHMLVSNSKAAALLRDLGATACTDVTGFGLLGHLVEMVNASSSEVGCKIDLDAIPTLPGAIELINRFPSSLAASNRRSVQWALPPARGSSSSGSLLEAATHPKFNLLFDPQTSGGLIISVPKKDAETVLETLEQEGYQDAAIIGQVLWVPPVATKLKSNENGCEIPRQRIWL